MALAQRQTDQWDRMENTAMFPWIVFEHIHIELPWGLRQ